jgi:hypothetical protein
MWMLAKPHFRVMRDSSNSLVAGIEPGSGVGALALAIAIIFGSCAVALVGRSRCIRHRSNEMPTVSTRSLAIPKASGIAGTVSKAQREGRTSIRVAISISKLSTLTIS